MKYQYNRFTGRLSESSPIQMPPKVGKIAEAPVIHYPIGTTFAKTVEGPTGRFLPKFLAEKMSLFQLPNKLPVHLKGGPMDRALAILTGAICAVGLFECFRVIYVFSYPQKKD